MLPKQPVRAGFSSPAVSRCKRVAEAGLDGFFNGQLAQEHFAQARAAIDVEDAVHVRRPQVAVDQQRRRGRSQLAMLTASCEARLVLPSRLMALVTARIFRPRIDSTSDK